jgi:hydroxymethylbilane synthase
VGASTLIRIGTRASLLARWQTEQVEEALHLAGHETERVELQTTGDVLADVPLAAIGSVAIFTRQLDEALLDGRVDLAVHSLKDLPTRLAPGIVLAAIGLREDPSDAFVGKDLTWDDLPRGATVATSSVRRKAQLLHLRPDLQVVPIRGNVDTRLAKLEQSTDWAGTVLASAGLIRLGLASRISTRLSPLLMLPAPGQGAVAVTGREENQALLRAAAAFDHWPSAVCGVAERGLLQRLDGGCQVPIGALAEATPSGSELRVRLRAMVLSLDGSSVIEDSVEDLVGSLGEAEALGHTLAETLVEMGAEEILGTARRQADGQAS